MMKPRFDFSKASTPDHRLFSDPFRPETRLSKRNLLFSSMVVLIAAAYGTESVTFVFTTLPSTAVLGVAGAVTAYYLATFLIAFASDIQEWGIAHNGVVGQEHLQRLRELSERMSAVDSGINAARSHMEGYLNACDERLRPIINEIRSALDGAESAQAVEALLSKLRATAYEDPLRRTENVNGAIIYLAEDARHYRKYLRDLARSTLEVRFVQYAKIWGWELMVPVALAVLALVHAGSEIEGFLRAVVQLA